MGTPAHMVIFIKGGSCFDFLFASQGDRAFPGRGVCSRRKEFAHRGCLLELALLEKVTKKENGRVGPHPLRVYPFPLNVLLEWTLLFANIFNMLFNMMKLTMHFNSCI